MQPVLSASILTENQLTCPKCNWHGAGNAAYQEDLFLTEALELYCPHCDHYFGFVSTSEEEPQK